MPVLLREWRRARADVAHDWLERRLLQVLNTGGSPEELRKRAVVCLGAWTEKVIPKLADTLKLLPDCLLPGLLLRGFLDPPDIESINRAALHCDAIPGLMLQDVISEAGRLGFSASVALQAYASEANAENRLAAFDQVMKLRRLLQQLPRSVVLP